MIHTKYRFANSEEVKAYYNEQGELHNQNGPAVEYISGLIKGRKEYYINGKLHRSDGPAIIHGGNKLYYINDKFHRLDGPAIEFANGDKAWYIDGKNIKCKTQKEFERLIKLRILW